MYEEKKGTAEDCQTKGARLEVARSQLVVVTVHCYATTCTTLSS